MFFNHVVTLTKDSLSLIFVWNIFFYKFRFFSLIILILFLEIILFKNIFLFTPKYNHFIICLNIIYFDLKYAYYFLFIIWYIKLCFIDTICFLDNSNFWCTTFLYIELLYVVLGIQPVIPNKIVEVSLINLALIE